MKDPSPNPSPQGEGESRLRTPFQIAPFAETNTPARNYGTSAGPLGLKVTPLARRLIAQNGIDLAGLARAAHAKGLGKIGRADVEAGGKRRAGDEQGLAVQRIELEVSRLRFDGATCRVTTEPFLAAAAEVQP